MKTYSIFTSEARIAWNTGVLGGSGKSPSDTAKQKRSQVSRTMTNRGNTPTDMVNIAMRLKRMKTGISSADEKSKVNDPRPETKDTETRRTGRQRVNTGYASKPADTRGRSGSLPSISSSAGEGSGSRVVGRYGDIRTGRSGGVRSTMVNKGISRTGEKFGRMGRA